MNASDLEPATSDIERRGKIQMGWRTVDDVLEYEFDDLY
jgi:hypothetical protein